MGRQEAGDEAVDALKLGFAVFLNHVKDFGLFLRVLGKNIQGFKQWLIIIGLVFFKNT